MNMPLHFILLFGISGGEIFIALLLVLVLFGPKKIPEIARTIGKGINEVKKVQRDINNEINRYADEIEKPVKQVENDIEGFKSEYYHAENEVKDSIHKDAVSEDNKDETDSHEGATEDEKKDHKEQPDDELPYPYNQQNRPDNNDADDSDPGKTHS